METAVAVAVVGSSGGGGGKDGGGGGEQQQPSARRDVREWQRVDAATGAVERARIQSDRWATRTATGQQRCYGKVVASSVRDAADGRPEAQSLRQVEVFRQRGPQGSFQVVRASSSTTTSTSSSSASPSSAAAAAAAARLQLAFDNLQLPLHRLDVGPQRTRASVARSGSLSARRPPTRQLRAIAAAPATITSGDSDATDANDEGSRKGPSQPGASVEDTQVDSLTAQVSRICGQLHVEARRAALGERDGDVRTEAPSPQASPSPHAVVARRRSNSIEDLQVDEGGRREESDIWDRASHVRRSLQFPSKPQDRESSPRPHSLAVGRFFSEDSKLCEGGKLKGLEAFENILRRGANIADSVNKSMTHDREDSDASSADSLAKHLRSGSIMDVYMRRNSAKGSSASSASKRHSFVTVESLKEVRERLRPLNSPSEDEPKTQKNIFKFPKDEEENDDGIVSDDHVKHPDSESGSEMAPSKVKSYILGMEILANNNKNGTRKPILGTGSLESRTSSRTSSSGTHRSEEWYNRRKSYGFEQVHAADVDNSRSNRLWEKNKVESSTDSGICRSSEAVSGLPWNRTSPTKIEEGKSLDFRKSENLLNMGIQIKQDNKEKILEDKEKEEESPMQQRRKTVVTLRNEGNKSSSNFKSGEDGSIVVHNSIIKDSSSMSMNDYRTSIDGEHRLKPFVGLRSIRDFQRPSKPVTITIPIISGDGEKENNEIEKQPNLFSLSSETSLMNKRSDVKSAFTNGSALKDNFKRGTWNGGDDWKKSMDNEMKRHSIAVDESKYVREGIKRYSNLHDSASKELANVSTSELVKRFAAMNNGKKDDGIFSNNDKCNYNSHTTGFNVSFVQNGDGLMSDDQNKKHKKVEFCKTEVHFAAESGRVNIVETDEKPPPSNPIRRRRRNSAAASIGDSVTKSNLPEIRFGDSPYEKQLLGGNETNDVTETPSAPVLVKPEPTRPTVLALGAFQKDIESDDHVYAQVKSVFTSSNTKESTLSSSCEETTSEHINITGLSNEQMPRSILKNNRKPKSFILSSSNDSTLESSDNQEDKWAVRLKPLHVNTDSSPAAMWRSTVTLRSTAFDNMQSSPTERKVEVLSTINAENRTENELQRMLRELRPAGQRKSTSDTDYSLNTHSSPVIAKKSISESSNNSVQVTVTSPETEPLFSGWSVADRVKQVEEMKHSSVETKGYSTRVNFGSGEATVVESGSSDDQQNLSLKPMGGPSLFQKSDKCKPMWLRREEKKQELQGSEPTVEEAPHSQVVTMSAMLPSYDQNRLRRVETLVSTRSGQPKITSIALRYEGDEPDDRQRGKSSSSTATNHGINSAWKNLEPAPSHSHLPPRRDEKVAIGFTYYKPKENPKEQTPSQDDRRDKTFKIEKHGSQLQIEEVLREKDSGYRGSLFSSERRSNSSGDYYKRSSSPSKRSSGFLSPTTPNERERERYLSPSPKPLSKPATYFGEHSSLSNSSFSNTYQKEFRRKSDDNRRSYERKSEENILLRSSANSSVSSVQKSVGESPSNHKRSSPEKTKKGDERVTSEGRRRSFDSPSRSQGPVRGRSLSPTKRLEPKSVQPAPEPEVNDYDSPIYENIDDLLEEPPSVRRAETDSAILEELTRAADQILQAVNGYTDEDSRASSDDDDLDRRHRRGRRGGRPAERMTTIDEAPARRAAAAAAAASASSSSGAAVTSRRSQQQQQRLARQCTRLAAHNSSTSSIESVTRESPQRHRAALGSAPGVGARALLTRERMVVEEARRKVCSAPAASATSASAASRGRSRAARLLQRASSRELLLDARASSSEDATSGAEAMPVRKLRVARRVRASSSSAAKSSSQAASASSSARRTSPAVAAPQQPTASSALAAAGTGVTGAARSKRRDAHDPKARSHGARPEDGRRRVSGRREESDVVRTRGSRTTGLLHQHPTSSAVITSSSSSRRAAASSGLQQLHQRRSTSTTASRSTALATTTTTTGSSTAATATAAAAGPSHAVAKKPSSSRSESLAHSNKISK